MSNLYPVCLDLRRKKCLVAGGGKVAERKIRALLDCGAEVYVVSPQLTTELAGMARTGEIVHIERNYTTTDLENAFLVISATDDEKTNRRVAGDCLERNILINVVDDPANCNFIVPAVFRQGALSISVSTEGKSPMLARKIREDLTAVFG
ncbi:bifunctional precorrin-2 dehydrogenase/sirohydrochlorin ferrochelatase, partial [bacterium]